MNNPKVSIIIPSYNYGHYIGECLGSCFDQTYQNIEVIVVDDKSTDNSHVVYRLYRKMYPYYGNEIDRFVLHKNAQNMGYSYCKNKGIELSTGEFIVHLDADDVLTPHSIEIRLNEFKKNPELDMVHGRAWRYRWDEDEKEWVIDGYNKSAKIHAQGVMIRRKVYEKFGLYYEKLRSKSDKEMWYRLGVHPKSPLPELIYAKKIKNYVAYYRKHEKQMHKLRRANKLVNTEINSIFSDRIKQLQKEGITKQNTRFL